MGGVMAREDKETKLVERVGFLSFLVNLGLSGLKAALACSSGSLAITASMIDSATDSAASLAVWGGLKLSTRKTRAFPYGLYKIENVIQVVMALFIFLAGYEVVEGILWAQGKPPAITMWVIGGMGVGVAIPLLFGWYTIVTGKRTGSPALVADGRHRQADVLSSLVVLAAVICDYAGWSFRYHGWTVDRVAAALVLVFIAYTGFELLMGGMRVLLDASVDGETLDRIESIVEAEPAVAEIHSLVGRNAGRFRFIEAHVVLRVDDLEKAHAAAKRIEENVRQKVPRIDRVLIHYEPPEKRTVVAAVPLESDRETVSKHFGEAPVFYFGAIRQSDGKIMEEWLADNSYANEEKGKGLKVSKWLVEQGVDRVYSPKSLEGRGPGYVLAEAGTEVKVIHERSLPELRERLKIGKGR